MYRTLRDDASFHVLLLAFDHDLAAREQAGGCVRAAGACCTRHHAGESRGSPEGVGRGVHSALHLLLRGARVTPHDDFGRPRFSWQPGEGNVAAAAYRSTARELCIVGTRGHRSFHWRSLGTWLGLGAERPHLLSLTTVPSVHLQWVRCRASRRSFSSRTARQASLSCRRSSLP